MGVLRWSGFNTQPPEGGCSSLDRISGSIRRFNTQPPEGGWKTDKADSNLIAVSTHSRLKAADMQKAENVCPRVFQHTAA